MIPITSALCWMMWRPRHDECCVLAGMEVEVMDFTKAESWMIGQIMKAEQSLPDDFWAVAAVQELACLLVKIEPLMTDEQMATLIGIGAFVARQGKAEMSAEIQMKMALAKAQGRV